jgi:hypothetical protein
MSKRRKEPVVHTIDEAIKFEIKSEMAPPFLKRYGEKNDDLWAPGGRPSSKNLVRAEAERRLAAGVASKGLADQLSRWLDAHHLEAPSMEPRTVQRHIRDIIQKFRRR